MNRHRPSLTYRLLETLFLIACLTVADRCPVAAAPLSASPIFLSGASGTQARYLYVLECCYNIYRFPLFMGLPLSQHPSSVLNIPRDISVAEAALAVGPDGSIYMSGQDMHTNLSFIYIYEPGASGNDRPRARLRPPNNHGVGTLWVDRFGFVYGDIWELIPPQGGRIYIYAPNPKTGDRPIEKIRMGTYDDPWGMVTDQDGALYVASSTLSSRQYPIYVYQGFPGEKSGTSPPRIVRQFCLHDNPQFLALNAQNEVLLAAGQAGQEAAISVLPASANACPMRARRKITPILSSDGTVFSPLYVAGVGPIATYGNLVYAPLYIQYAHAYGQLEVFIFDSTKGRQKPLYVLTMQGLGYWADTVAIGP